MDVIYGELEGYSYIEISEELMLPEWNAVSFEILTFRPLEILT